MVNRLLVIALIHWHNIVSMDLRCSNTNTDLCKINIDGGNDLDVALVLQERHFENISDSFDDYYYAIVSMDKYERPVDEMDYSNETFDEQVIEEFVECTETIEKIQLEYMNLTKIKRTAFSGATALFEIDLDNNQILYIGENAFIDLGNLTTLSLTRNNLTVIRVNTFAGAFELKRLHLNHNKIHAIEDGALNLPNLEHLLLQNNKLKTLSPSLFVGTPQLKEAVFEENELEQIGEAFAPLKQLRILVLDYNQIDDINLSKLAKLSELNHLSLRKSGYKPISDNEYDAGGDNSSYESSSSPVEVLELAENGLMNSEHIMHQLTIFPNIEILNLEFNEFTHLGYVYEFNKWFPKLKIINLAFNPLHCKWVETYGDYLKMHNIKVLPFSHSLKGCIPDDDE